MTKMHLPPPIEKPPEGDRWGAFILLTFVLTVAVGVAVAIYLFL